MKEKTPKKRGDLTSSHFPNVKGNIEYFLDDLCVQWGFCISPEDRERIAGLSPLTANQFANELLCADGFVPEHEKKWRQKLKLRFVERFGSDIIS